MNKTIKVALIGNPNTGKTSVFNQLTGLRQKVGNYSGVTVEKKEGSCQLPQGYKAHLLDLPGTYSLNTTSLDERVAVELLLNEDKKEYPDVVVVISDVEHLKRNLLLFTQVKDLQLPTLLVINMADRMARKGITLEVAALEKKLDTKIALVSTRKGEGMEYLKTLIAGYALLSTAPTMVVSRMAPDYSKALQKTLPEQELYKLWLSTTQAVKAMSSAEETTHANPEVKKLQHKETVLRYQFINNALKEVYTVDFRAAKGLGGKLDRVLTHRIGGYVIFSVLLLAIFQAIFEWSSYPMDYIDAQFARTAAWIKDTFPPGVFTDLLAEGIIAGIGGVVIFIPQIAFLFLFLALLEESGYMNRVVFLMDRVMRPFGLSGKSVVPLISGTACAIPAVMATRTIENWKERLITILVTPFTTCSARLPVYLILIALVIPQGQVLGLSYQALMLLLLYLLGFGMALLSAVVLHKIFKTESRTLFMVEMPTYQVPLLRNVAYTVLEKTKSFVLGAGKIILAISIVLWFLGSHGYSKAFTNAESIVTHRIMEQGLSPYSKNYVQQHLNAYKQELTSTPKAVSPKALQDAIQHRTQLLREEARIQEIASYQLEHSYIGYAGKALEPLVRPLGYDWKIGIALLTSFAAREVFVGTLATLYSVGSDAEETLQNRMAAEVAPSGKKPLFTLASGISLMLFYAFAMQCMSTLAIVKRETNSWKWPLLQLVCMSAFAYFVALVAYQLLK